jgi:hypothetical protein
VAGALDSPSDDLVLNADKGARAQLVGTDLYWVGSHHLIDFILFQGFGVMRLEGRNVVCRDRDVEFG